MKVRCEVNYLRDLKKGKVYDIKNTPGEPYIIDDVGDRRITLMRGFFEGSCVELFKIVDEFKDYVDIVFTGNSVNIGE